MTREKYIDLLFRVALKPNPSVDSLRALDEVIKLTERAIKSLKQVDKPRE